MENLYIIKLDILDKGYKTYINFGYSEDIEKSIHEELIGIGEKYYNLKIYKFKNMISKYLYEKFVKLFEAKNDNWFKHTKESDFMDNLIKIIEYPSLDDRSSKLKVGKMLDKIKAYETSKIEMEIMLNDESFKRQSKQFKEARMYEEHFKVSNNKIQFLNTLK